MGGGGGGTETRHREGTVPKSASEFAEGGCWLGSVGLSGSGGPRGTGRVPGCLARGPGVRGADRGWPAVSEPDKGGG